MGAVNNEEAGFCILIREACAYCEMLADKCKNDEMDLGIDFASEILNKIYNSQKGGSDLGFKRYMITPGQDYFLSAMALLDETFLINSLKDDLKSLLEELSKTRQELLSSLKPEAPFPPYQMLLQYLEKYYTLLKKIFYNLDELKEANLRYDFLQFILNVDVVSTTGKMTAKLYSPVVLDCVKCLYDALPEYYATMKVNNDQELRQNYQEIFISKLLRLFRWGVLKDGQLMHAALPPYLAPDADESLRCTLDIPVRHYEEYSSYEGIGELRLIDKIIYELENRYMEAEDTVDTEVEISIFGDVNYRPMQRLCDILAFTLSETAIFKNISISFIIYTNNQINADRIKYTAVNNHNIISYQFKKYEGELKDPKFIKMMINEFDIIFILDSCDIYKELSVDKMTDKDLYWQRIASDSYNRTYSKAKRANLIRKGALLETISVLNAFRYSGEPGRFYKEANNTLLRYLENECNEWNREHERKVSVYIYVSDLKAFHNIYFDNTRFIRIERYNEKEIAIVRFASFWEDNLPVLEEKEGGNDAERILVFNIWQLIKHIAVRELEHFSSYFGIENTKIYQLRKILVGIDYNNWPECLDFYYYIPDEFGSDMEQKVREYLENAVLPFFGRHEPDMYYDYFIKSFGSFLYSDARNVDDMLFLHLFIDRHELLKEAKLVGADKRLSVYKANKCKYSIKRFYADIMKDYDTPASVFATKYMRLEQIEKGGKLSRKEAMKNILAVCEHNRYKDSYLYQNCSSV